MVYKKETNTFLVSLKSFQPQLRGENARVYDTTSDNYTGSAVNCKKIVTELEFYVLLTVHLDAILGNDQLDALFLNVFIFIPLHVSSSMCSSSGGPNCINTSSGITHSGE
jgi:hypothetical protein